MGKGDPTHSGEFVPLIIGQVLDECCFLEKVPMELTNLAEHFGGIGAPMRLCKKKL